MLGADTHASEATSFAQGDWATLKSAEQAKLKLESISTDLGDCSNVPFPGGPPTPTISLPPRVSEWRQYLDVDCSHTNYSGGLVVPVDTVFSTQYVVQAATAQFESLSNVKDAEVAVLDTQANGATVRYALTGLDREFLGNCPGGGHGTLVVRFHLVAK